MKTKSLPLTYTGSNADNLYVSAWKNGKAVKLRVKELDCHGGIITEGLTYSATIFESVNELKAEATAGNLIDCTIYAAKSGDILVEYLYINNQLKQLGGLSESTEDKNLAIYSTSFASFEALRNHKSLAENIIYTVDDKGTLEQYIYKNGKIVQISGAINEVIEGSVDDESISSTSNIPNGIINYNLEELVNGDYRYKNHSELHTVVCDMPCLVSGVQMFWGTSLTSFCGNLGSLENGQGMFGKNCKLDEDSIINIVDSIKENISDEPNNITIGYNSSLISSETITNFTKEFASKGWQVTWLADGSYSVKTK